jgi:hypothetical protein
MLPTLYSFASKYPILLSFLFPAKVCKSACGGSHSTLLHNGVAFEVHLQNTLLCLTCSSHMPLGFILHDLGGMHIHPQTLYTSTGCQFAFLLEHCIVTLTHEEVAKKLASFLKVHWNHQDGCHNHLYISLSLSSEQSDSLSPITNLLWKLLLMLHCGFCITDSSVHISAIQLSTHGELYLQGAMLTIFILIFTPSLYSTRAAWMGFRSYTGNSKQLMEAYPQEPMIWAGLQASLEE